MTLQQMDRLASAPELRYVPSAVRKVWGDDPAKEAHGLDPGRAAQLRSEYEFYARLAKWISGSGAGVLAGSDTCDPHVVPGFGLHDELEAMVAAGYSPVEALTTATLSPARYFDLEATHGTIAKGKAGNLLLLDADPASDIRNTRRISAVLVAGRMLNRACLDSLLSGKQVSCPAPPSASAASSPRPAVPAVKRKSPHRQH